MTHEGLMIFFPWRLSDDIVIELNYSRVKKFGSIMIEIKFVGSIKSREPKFFPYNLRLSNISFSTLPLI